MLIFPRNGTPEHLAAVLYCAFADAVEWKYSSGKPMPAFVCLSDAAQAGWTVVARRAIDCGANPDTSSIGHDLPAERNFVPHEGDEIDLDMAARGGEAA